ncbi:hypothetical protein DUNSADRAFT_7431, partial [Dunaliella salina]
QVRNSRTQTLFGSGGNHGRDTPEATKTLSITKATAFKSNACADDCSSSGRGEHDIDVALVTEAPLAHARPHAFANFVKATDPAKAEEVRILSNIKRHEIIPCSCAPAQVTAPAASGAIRIHPEYHQVSQNHPLLTRTFMLLLVAPAQATAPVVAEATRMMTLQKKRGARTRIALLGASARGSATGSVTVMAAGTGIGIGIEIGIGTESGSVVEARAAAGIEIGRRSESGSGSVAATHATESASVMLTATAIATATGIVATGGLIAPARALAETERGTEIGIGIGTGTPAQPARLPPKTASVNESAIRNVTRNASVTRRTRSIIKRRLLHGMSARSASVAEAESASVRSGEVGNAARVGVQSQHLLLLGRKGAARSAKEVGRVRTARRAAASAVGRAPHPRLLPSQQSRARRRRAGSD